MRLGIVIDGLELELPKFTSTGLALAAASAGHDVHLIPVAGFSCADGRPAAHAFAVPRPPPGSREALLQGVRDQALRGERVRLDLTELDALLLRSDPARGETAAWAREAGITFGRLAERHGVFVANAPDGLARALDKSYLQYFPADLQPRNLVSRDRDEIAEFVERAGRAVIKPLAGSGGRNVFFLEAAHPENRNQIVEAVLRDHYALVQEYLPEASEGDVRLFLVDGEILVADGRPAALFRRHLREDFRSNVTQGAEVEVPAVTDRMRAIAERLKPRLRADGMFLVGVDLAGDHVMEINVFSPGGLNNASRLAGVDFRLRLIELLEERLDRDPRNRTERIARP